MAFQVKQWCLAEGVPPKHPQATDVCGCRTGGTITVEFRREFREGW